LLRLDPVNLTVVKPNGQVGAMLPWKEVTSLAVAGNVQMPDGRPAFHLMAETSSSAHRFVVPSEDADASTIEAKLSPFAALCKGGSQGSLSSRRISPLLAGVVLVVAAVVVAVLLLFSAGAIK
jgi:hypothetical protein